MENVTLWRNETPSCEHYGLYLTEAQAKEATVNVFNGKNDTQRPVTIDTAKPLFWQLCEAGAVIKNCPNGILVDIAHHSFMFTYERSAVPGLDCIIKTFGINDSGNIIKLLNLDK